MHNMYVKNLALKMNVFSKLKSLSETLENQNITLPKAHTLLTTYTKPFCFPEKE